MSQLILVLVVPEIVGCLVDFNFLRDREHGKGTRFAKPPLPPPPPHGLAAVGATHSLVAKTEHVCALRFILIQRNTTSEDVHTTRERRAHHETSSSSPAQHYKDASHLYNVSRYSSKITCRRCEWSSSRQSCALS